MTKRQEIRKGIEDYTDRPAALWDYLHSQGVVITSNTQDWTDKDNLHKRRIVEPLVEE